MKGQIRKALSGFYYVYADGDTYQTRARGNFRNRKITPLVGDAVIFQSEQLTDGYLLEILPRKNELLRPPVANVDQGIVVVSMKEPAFSAYLLDRFLVTLEADQIAPIIYLSKVDLLEESDQALLAEIQQIYENIGYPIVLSPKDLVRYFPEKLTVFMGQSGVGKSTALNRIAPELNLATDEVSFSLNRGKHTTRHVELLPLYDGLVADTPGFSSIHLLEIEATALSAQFPEFRAPAKQCKFRACLHRKEPNCAVKAAVESGTIAASRYENYLRFLEEIEQQKPTYRKKRSE